MKTLLKNFYLAIFCICLLISIVFFQSSLDYYFFQDDFFELNISKASNLGEYLGFYLIRPDIIAYRPISLQNYFFIASSIFGANSLGFRFTTYVLFLLSAFLIAKVIAKITKSNSAGLLVASIWVTSSIHFLALTWIAAAYMIIGTFFFFLTSYIFLKFLKTGSIIFYAASIFSFILTVGSFEFSITWPAIFALYCAFLLKKPALQTIKLFWPFLAISIIYLVLRLLFIKVPQIPEYTVTLNIESARAFFWYILWSLNIPEEFKKQVVDNVLIFNSKFSQEFYPLMLKTFFGAIAIMILVISALAISIKRKLKINNRLVVFLLAWFLIAISPVLIIPNHTFIMYLTLAAIGLYALIAYQASIANDKLLALLIIVIWLWSSTTTLAFYKHNFWMVQAQKTAREFAANMKKQYPTLPTGAIVLYPLQSQHELQALLENHALRAIYNDKSLVIYYNKEVLLKDLGKLKGKPIYLLTHD